MAKFHITGKGKPAICHAKGACPLGGDSGKENHFNSEKEAQDYIDKGNEKDYGLLPGVDKAVEVKSAENKKLTPTQIKSKESAERKQRLTSNLEKYWQNKDGTPDQAMVKHCLKSSKYVEIEDAFVDIGDSKPTIYKEMYYDDETDGPEANFNNFRNYNVRMGMPKPYKLEGRNRDGFGTLKMVPQYDGAQGFGLSTLTYEDDHNSEYREVTESQLEEINKGIEEVKDDYEKRLQTYYKRYKDQISAKGYWKNR